MPDDIVFLHTAQVHIATFSRLLSDLAPDVHARHEVREDLLREAQQVGAEDVTMVSKVQQAMVEAASSGAPLVVCTCSTIGGAAERVLTQGRFAALRIDRAMADRAVAVGARILLVAALESTLGPTETLLRDSAQRAGKPVEIRNLVLADAWRHFLAGDTERFAAAIEQAVRRKLENAQVVVLAQASMAPAQAKLADLGVGY